MRHTESILQRACIQWFRLQYPEYALLCFAVPNGGARSKIEASILKAEGVVAGVADLILLVPRRGYSSLCIEMKTQAKGSTQSPSQKRWQHAAESAGNKYVVVRSIEEFIKIVNEYLGHSFKQ